MKNINNENKIVNSENEIQDKIKNKLDSTKFFEAVSSLTKYNIDLNLPTIILFGNQSDGKSSIVDVLTGDGEGLSPKDHGLATKKPIHITTLRSDKTKYIINDNEFFK